MIGTKTCFETGPETTADIVYQIAATRAQREAAFRLVYRSYIEAGLGVPNGHQMRVTPYHLLPTTETFIATLRGDAIFTVSLVIDGELGLPMETVYGDEVEQRRREGLRFGEVSCLADRRANFRGSFPVFLRLCRLMVQYARRRNLHQLLVAVHPRHVRFYRKFLDFRVVGELRDYPTVRNHPAVALCLDFERIDRELPENYDTFFGQPLPPWELEPSPISEADREYFRAMVDPTFKLAPLAPGMNASPSEQTELVTGAA